MYMEHGYENNEMEIGEGAPLQIKWNINWNICFQNIDVIQWDAKINIEKISRKTKVVRTYKIKLRHMYL